MLVTVCGATGRLGRAVVTELSERGHDVRVLSRSARSGPAIGAVAYQGDLVTGEGLHEALAGVDAVIDATNVAGSGRKARPLLIDGCRRLLHIEAAEGIGHHLAISVVGTDKVPISYYRTKLEQEHVVQQGPIPWSLVRATQFHEVLDFVFTASARAGIIPAMSFPLAPIDPRFVARMLADAVESGPGGWLAPLAGPRAQPLAELARTWKRARGRRSAPVALPLIGTAGRRLKAGALIPNDAVTGGPDFETWLGELPGRHRCHPVAAGASE